MKKIMKANHRGSLMDEPGEVASSNERGGEAAGDDDVGSTTVLQEDTLEWRGQ